MEELESLTMGALEGCTYRDLQRYAKYLGLPSNVKKCSLVEMIQAKRFSSREHFESVVARIRAQRKQAAKPRKKKKKRVQGNEISSTSNQSPPISTTPQPTYLPYTESTSHTIMQCQTSILNPLITKRSLNTDRVLRSFNNKLKRNLKYLNINEVSVNINNTTMGVIKSQNMVKSSVQERVYEWNAEVQRYQPVRSVLQKGESIEAEDLVLRQPHPIAACSKQQTMYDDSEATQLVPVRNVNPGPRSERRVSGVYPLKPAEKIQHKSSYITYRRQDGRVCKVNEFLPQQRPTNMVHDKMTQTKALSNIRQIIISRGNTIPMSKISTTQDVVNRKVEGSFSSSSTETAEDSSYERVYSTREQPRKGPESFKTVDSVTVLKRKPGPKCYARLLQKRLTENEAKKVQQNNITARFVERKDDEHKNFSAPRQQNRDERDSSLQCRRMYSLNVRSGANRTKVNSTGTDKSRLVENINHQSSREPCGQQNQIRESCHGSYAAENHIRPQKHGFYAVENQTRQDNHGSYAVENQTRQNNHGSYAVENQTRQNNHGSYAVENQTRQNNHGSYAVENQTRQDNHGSYAVEVQTRQNNHVSYAVEIQTRQNSHGSYALENQTRQNNHGSYALENQTRQNYHGSYAVENQNTQNSTAYAKVNQDQTNYNLYTNRQNNNDMYAMEHDKNYGSYAKTQNHYTEEYRYAYTSTEDQSAAKFNKNQRNLHLDDQAQNKEHYEYIEIRNENSVSNGQNFVTNLHTDMERDYPNMSGLSEVYPESVVSVTQAVDGLSGSKMELYYHKKIRAEQVRAKRVSRCLDWELVPTSCTTLPRITSVFSHITPQYRDLMRPLYVDTGVPSSSSSVLECLYNYSGRTLASPLSEHHVLRTTSHTNTVFSTPLIATAAPHEPAPVYPQNRNDSYVQANEKSTVEVEQIPRLQDYLRAAESEPRDITCDEVVQQSPVSSWSAGSGALSTEIEDALDYISQDGDYMERIERSIDMRARCFLCAWAGPRTILEYHVRMNHPTEILVSESPAWSHRLELGRARDGVRLLTEYAGQVYVVSVLCRSNTTLHADLTMLPKDNESEFPVYGRLTMYNKVTGEPFTWEGEVTYPPLTEEENETSHYNLDQTGSQLINHDETRCDFVTPDQNRSELINPYQTLSELNSVNNETNEQNPMLKRLLQSTTQSMITSSDMTDRTNQNEPIRYLGQGSKKSKPDLETIDNNLPHFGQEILNLDEPNVLHLGQNQSDGLNIDLTSLNLLPNSANLMLVNGEWVLKSAAKVVAGQPALDNIEVVIYVQILE